MNDYSRIEFVIDEEAVSEEEAKKSAFYSKDYFNDKDQRVKVEVYQQNELCAVQYYRITEPYEKILERHGMEYPHITASIARVDDETEEGHMCKMYAYDEGKLTAIVACYSDKKGNPLRDDEFDLKDENRIIISTLYHYDEDGELCLLEELNEDGVVVGRNEIME